jgi:hypothetical protein
MVKRLNNELAPLLFASFGDSEKLVEKVEGRTSMLLQAFSRTVSSSGSDSESPMGWMEECLLHPSLVSGRNRRFEN